MSDLSAPPTPTEFPGDSGWEEIRISIPRGTKLEMSISNQLPTPEDSSTVSCCTGTTQQIQSTIHQAVRSLNLRSLANEALNSEDFDGDPMVSALTMLSQVFLKITEEACRGNQPG